MKARTVPTRRIAPILFLTLLILAGMMSGGLSSAAGDDGETQWTAAVAEMDEAAYPVATPDGVLFTFEAPWADHVAVAGDFNGWDDAATVMNRNDNGIWWIAVSLGAGSQQYKFVVDGNWEGDPMNPDTAGEYGNSVVTVQGDGSLIPLPAREAPPLNPNIAFHGDFRSNLSSDLDEDGPFRLENSTHDVKLDLDCALGEDMALWARLRMSSDSETSSLERLNFRMSNPRLSFRAFYNVYAAGEIDLGDPYGLTADIGEFHDAYGRDAQGLYLHDIAMGPFLTGALLYGNDIDSGEDMAAARISASVRNVDLGLLYRRKSGLDAGYSLPGGAGGEYGQSQIFGADFSFAAGGYSVFRGEILAGQDEIRDQDNSSGDILDRAILYGAWQQLLARGIRMTLRGTWEALDYTGLAGSRKADMVIGGITLDLLGTGGNLPVRRLDFEYIRYFMEEDFPWTNLWDFDETSRLEINEYVTTGYRQKLRFSTILNLGFSRVLDVDLSYRPILDIVPEAGGPWMLEQVAEIDLRWKKLALLNSLRAATCSSEYLDLDQTFFSGYHAIEYSLSRQASIRLGYGLRPEDIDDELREREGFLHDLGLTANSVKTNYTNLDRVITAAEEELEKYTGLRLEGRLRF